MRSTLLPVKLVSESTDERLRRLISKSLGRGLAYSVYWEKHLRGFDARDPLGWSGIGGGAFLGLTPRRVLPMLRARLEVALSTWASRAPRVGRTTGPRIAARVLCRRQGRAYDYEIWRHVNVLKTLEDSGALSGDSVCIIGDGLGTLAGLLAFYPSAFFRRIFVVNLPELLLLDYLMLRRSGIGEDAFFVVETEAEIQSIPVQSATQFILLSAERPRVLSNSGINLFLNIDSMQEMNRSSIEEYFSIINSNGAMFYCCNMKSKKLRDGTMNDFHGYPWGASRVLLDGEPKWLRSFVRLRLPWGKFRAPVGKFRIPHWHRLTVHYSHDLRP